MAIRVTSWLSRTGLLRTLLSHIRLAYRLVREPRVPLLTKLLPLAAAVYVVSPLDFLPDVIPIVGQLDDLTILLVALEAFLRWSPPAAVEFHRGAIDQRLHYSPMSPTDGFIDTEWRHEP